MVADIVIWKTRLRYSEISIYSPLLIGV